MDDSGGGGDDRTPYWHMSDDEFLDELRRHQGNEDWTLGHWLELERRGMAILDADPELRAAVRAQWDRTFTALQNALEPIREHFAEQFRAMMPDLSRVMPTIDYSKFAPTFELDLPKFELHEFVAPELPGLRTDSILDEQDTIASLAEIQEEVWERENEVRQAQIATAEAAARQVELLNDIEQRNQARHEQLIAGYDKVADEVRSGHQPRWTVWVMLVLTAIAAVGSVLAVIVSLG